MLDPHRGAGMVDTGILRELDPFFMCQPNLGASDRLDIGSHTPELTDVEMREVVSNLDSSSCIPRPKSTHLIIISQG